MVKIDPLKRSCICGYFWHFNKFDYIRMILFGGLTYTCPQCLRKHQYKLIYHAVEEFNPTKNENKLLIDKKSDVWRKG